MKHTPCQVTPEARPGPPRAAENSLLEAALSYAARGWPVIPLWWAVDGKCACGQAACDSPAKHPIGKLAPHGLKDATVDPDKIRTWWERFPQANIGILTGPESGLMVVDVDPRHGGDDSLKKLPGNMPYTPTVSTGGNGEHYYLRLPEGEIPKNLDKAGFPGIDLKGAGGYVVAAPSGHVSNKKYVWKITPDSTPIAPTPAWLEALIARPQAARVAPAPAVGETIAAGGRNETLTSLAGSMRRRGMSPEAIEAALLAENQRCDPPLADTEVMRIAGSVSRYDPAHGLASGGGWPEPEPLRRTPEPPESYPIEALGEVLAPAALAIHDAIKAPLAICGQSVLAAACLSVQGHADVAIDGRSFPVSENFIAIALSGERKSAADQAALAPVGAYARVLMDQYLIAKRAYDNEYDLWKRERDQALKTKDPLARREELEALPPAPPAPPYPKLTTEEPTYEGLVKLLAHGWPSMGICSDEAGRFLGGYAMSADHRLKTLAGLSALWDGRPIDRTRGGDGAITLWGRRVCVHFLLQPLVAENLFADSLAHEQGFLSRCLICYPGSALGNQTYSHRDLTRDAAYGRYCARLTAILEADLPLKIDQETGEPRNELIPRPLGVAPDAKAIWVHYHDHIQAHLGPNGAFRPISGFAAKAAEHSLRLAGVLTLANDLKAQDISEVEMRAGIVLSQFYLGEALRLFHTAQTNPDLLLAEKVLTWLKRAGAPALVSLPDVYQSGPNACRDKATAARILAILCDHGLTRQVEGGAVIDGKRRRVVYEVRPDV